MNILKSLKAKILAVGSALFVGANSAMASGLTMGADGTVSGTLDSAPVFAVVSALFAVFGAIIVAKIALNFIKRG